MLITESIKPNILVKLLIYYANGLMNDLMVNGLMNDFLFSCARYTRKFSLEVAPTTIATFPPLTFRFRQTSGIPTRKGNKRPNHESQNTDAQGTRAPATTLYVLCGL